MDAHRRIRGVDIRAASRDGPKMIADRILDPQRDELEASQRRALGRHVHPDRVVGREPFGPGDAVRKPVDVLLARIAAARQPPQNPCRQAAFQIDAITDGPVAGKAHATMDSFDGGGTELRKFLGKHRLEPSRAGAKEEF
jgi:hypothetical protein